MVISEALKEALKQGRGIVAGASVVGISCYGASYPVISWSTCGHFEVQLG